MPEGSQCQKCTHYYGALRCEAYPADQIPQSFLNGSEAHDSEEPDQVPGVLFEQLQANQEPPGPASQ